MSALISNFYHGINDAIRRKVDENTKYDFLTMDLHIVWGVLEKIVLHEKRFSKPTKVMTTQYLMDQEEKKTREYGRQNESAEVNRYIEEICSLKQESYGLTRCQLCSSPSHTTQGCQQIILNSNLDRGVRRGIETVFNVVADLQQNTSLCKAEMRAHGEHFVDIRNQLRGLDGWRKEIDGRLDLVLQ